MSSQAHLNVSATARPTATNMRRNNDVLLAGILQLLTTVGINSFEGGGWRVHALCKGRAFWASVMMRNVVADDEHNEMHDQQVPARHV
jgi:hypothetical protein